MNTCKRPMFGVMSIPIIGVAFLGGVVAGTLRAPQEPARVGVVDGANFTIAVDPEIEASFSSDTSSWERRKYRFTFSTTAEADQAVADAFRAISERQGKALRK